MCSGGTTNGTSPTRRRKHSQHIEPLGSFDDEQHPAGSTKKRKRSSAPIQYWTPEQQLPGVAMVTRNLELPSINKQSLVSLVHQQQKHAHTLIQNEGRLAQVVRAITARQHEMQSANQTLISWMLEQEERQTKMFTQTTLQIRRISGEMAAMRDMHATNQLFLSQITQQQELAKGTKN